MLNKNIIAILSEMAFKHSEFAMEAGLPDLVRAWHVEKAEQFNDLINAPSAKALKNVHDNLKPWVAEAISKALNPPKRKPIVSEEFLDRIRTRHKTPAPITHTLVPEASDSLRFLEQQKDGPLQLASEQCGICKGRGAKRDRNRSKIAICKCVLRRIFNICYRRVLLVASGPQRPVITRRRNGPFTEWDQLDYFSDFYSILENCLERDELVVFHLCFVCQYDWKMGLQLYLQTHRKFYEKEVIEDGKIFSIYQTPKPLDKGQYFHKVYRLQERVGLELLRHGLYPIFAYFTKKVSRANYLTANQDPWLNGGAWKDFKELVKSDQFNSVAQWDTNYKSRGKMGGWWRKRPIQNDDQG